MRWRSDVRRPRGVVVVVVGVVAVDVGVGVDADESSRVSFVPPVFDPDKSIRIKVALHFALAGEK